MTLWRSITAPRLKLTLYIISFTAACLQAGPLTALQVQDDTGRMLQLEQPARRVITLAPHLTELLYEIGAGDLIVASVEFSDYPLAAQAIPRVGNADNLHIETILAYQPDLILAWHSGNRAEQLLQLEQLGLPVYRSEPQSLEDVPDTVERLGRLTGHDAQAGTVSAMLRSKIRTLTTRYADRPIVSAFYQIWPQPLYTINGQHVISDVMRRCGVRNVFAQATLLAPQVNEEAVLAANPEMIIASESASADAQTLLRWKKWPQMHAVRAGNLYRINADLMQRHTARLLQGAEQLCTYAEQAREKRGQAH